MFVYNKCKNVSIKKKGHQLSRYIIDTVLL